MSRIGACFLAVCRGKVSEGIDFADADARAVVITGIPYPSVFDPKVSLKKKFLDAQKGPKSLSGTDWYNLEAFRAINQAVGRVIRHKDDFGSVILLDKRFETPSYCSKLSTWLPPVSSFKEFKASISSLETFFSRHHYFPKPTAPAPKAVLGEKKRLFAANASNVVKSGALKSTLQPPAKKQRIVIKPRQQQDQQQPLGVSDGKSSTCEEASASAAEAAGSISKTSSRFKSKTDIQHFVLSLKERLEKKELKEVIVCVKMYKEQGRVQPLAEKLRSVKDKLLAKDISEFRSFVRSAEDKSIFDGVFARG